MQNTLRGVVFHSKIIILAILCTFFQRKQNYIVLPKIFQNDFNCNVLQHKDLRQEISKERLLFDDPSQDRINTEKWRMKNCGLQGSTRSIISEKLVQFMSDYYVNYALLLHNKYKCFLWLI